MNKFSFSSSDEFNDTFSFINEQISRTLKTNIANKTDFSPRETIVASSFEQN